MNWTIVKNDFKQNKIINLALLLFMALSASLTIVSVGMMVQTFGSIAQMYEAAQPPHFLQMHKGALEEDAILTFMDSYEGLKAGQIVEMIDVYGDDLTVIKKASVNKLTQCQLDIGLVKQNADWDQLLNAQHEKVILQKGELGVPVLLRDTYHIEIGDTIALDNNGIHKEFMVTEFVLDAQMNSTMCSSTRILLSDEDFQEMAGYVGETEYLIEALFEDSGMAVDFQTAYETAKLPQNGQAITYSMLFLLSAMTDLATVFLLLLASALLIGVSFLCLKYTMMAALEEDILEIGSMKAIGLTFKQIRNLYLAKYRALAMIGVFLGFVLSIFLNRIVTGHVRETFGGQGMPPLGYILSIGAALLVYLFICHHCKKILKKLKTVTVVDALVYENGVEKRKQTVRDGLYKGKWLSANWLLGSREVIWQFRNWIVVFGVMMIATWMIRIPIDFVNTMEEPEFVTYMGSPLDDILVEVENGAGLTEHCEEIRKLLMEDAEVESVYAYRRVCVQMQDAEGEKRNLHVDCGLQAGEGLKYLSGEAPETEQEIALSLLNQSVAGKEVGDELTIYVNDEEQTFKVSGIYQDVTSGGYTAKTQHEFEDVQAEKYSFSVNVSGDYELAERKAKEWSDIIGTGVTIMPMKEFMNQTLGGVVAQLRIVVVIVCLLGACLSGLLTVLFLKLRMAKDVKACKVLRVMGFSGKDICCQYLIKTGLVSGFGILTGMITSRFLGEGITGALLAVAGLGIRKVQFIVNPLVSWFLCPVLLLLLILIVTRVVVGVKQEKNLIS